MSRRRSRRAGTVSVEILVMLPVFVVLFHAVFYLYGLSQAAQLSGMRARACAWQLAMAGCEGPRPSLCAGVDVRGAGDIDDSKLDSDTDSVFDEVSTLPVIGPVIAKVFGEGTSATASTNAKGLMGADPVAMSRRSYVVCNTTPKTFGHDLLGLACDVAGDPPALCR